MKNRITRLVALAIFIAFLASQTKTNAKTTSDAKLEDVVQLSAFSVSSGSERGYIASESMSGSRVATAIKNARSKTENFFRLMPRLNIYYS